MVRDIINVITICFWKEIAMLCFFILLIFDFCCQVLELFVDCYSDQLRFIVAAVQIRFFIFFHHNELHFLGFLFFFLYLFSPASLPAPLSRSCYTYQHHHLSSRCVPSYISLVCEHLMRLVHVCLTNNDDILFLLFPLPSSSSSSWYLFLSSLCDIYFSC